MTKTTQKAWLLGQAFSFAIFFALVSCNPTQLTPSGTRSSVVNGNGDMNGFAYVYKESPYVLSQGNATLDNIDIGHYLDKTPELITTNNELTSNCALNLFFYFSYPRNVSNCVKSLATSSDAVIPPRNTDGTFIFPEGSQAFYQTNTLYHVNVATKKFFDKLSFAYNTVQALPASMPKSIPSYLKDSGMYWFRGVASIDSQTWKNDYLTSYAFCNNVNNAYFNPIGPSLCFGSSPTHPNLLIVQDPSVVYHEFGHAMVAIMMNLRNGDASSVHPFRSNLLGKGYDEMGSLNEGLADYLSFMVTKRTHMGEWALGLTVNQDRPMSEDDHDHISALSTTPEGRLSYPLYVLYDPNNPDKIQEDVHYAGQIMSHYLVALTKSLETTCGLTGESDGGHEKATSYVLLLLAETLSELGDLNAKGVDDFGAPYSASFFFNNLDSTNSFVWSQYVNATTYRRFAQVMAKNIYKYISSGLCTAFDKNVSEKLLDDYGLLLFKTYNNNGNSTKSRALAYSDAVPFINPQALTPVSENNRRKSVLISKSLVDLAGTNSTTNGVNFFIIDGITEMQNLLKDLLFKGFPIPLSTNVASTQFNNSNIKISPGEIVGLIPNLYNSSNSTIAGVKLLANDWDHVSVTDPTTGNFKPCVRDGANTNGFDTATTVDQGGENGGSCATTETEYKRLVRNPSTGLFPTDASAPVCMVQLENGTSSRWVSQNEFRKKQGLSLQDKDCLGYSSSGTSIPDYTFNPHECLVRFLPGANTAFFSKIDSQKTYFESVVKDSSTKSFNPGNLLILEVNKWIPPGTKFRCRMRASFSNCSDCHADATRSNDDYLDSELNGPKPYKIINFDFDVND